MRRYALAAILVLMLLGLGVHWWWQRQEVAFTPSEWRGADPDGRGRMVRDLMRSRRLLGLPAGQIEGLLGPPDWCDEDIRCYKFRRHPGMTPFDPWPYTLNVEVDQTGRVTAVYEDD